MHDTGYGHDISNVSGRSCNMSYSTVVSQVSIKYQSSSVSGALMVFSCMLISVLIVQVIILF